MIWVKLCKLHSGHRLFRDTETQAIAIADNSGATPDQTDDGTLWLDFARPLVLSTKDVVVPVATTLNPRRIHEYNTIATLYDVTTLLGLEGAC